MKTYLTLIITFFLTTKQILASGVVDGGHCYNGWHLSGGSCHPPHSGGFLTVVIVILVIIGVIYWMKKGD